MAHGGFSQSGSGSAGGGGSASSVTVTNFPASQTVAGQVNVTVSGSTGLMVAAPPGAPVNVTGSVGISGITFPETINTSFAGIAQPVTGTVIAQVTVTGSTGLATSVTNFPASQTVSFAGTSQPVSMSNQPTVNVTVTGSTALPVSVAAWGNNVTGSITGSVSISQPTIFPVTSASYWAATPLTANITMPSIDISKAWDQAFFWTINAPLLANVSGSIALRNSNDNVNFNDAVQANQTRTAVAVGPGNTVQSGSFVGVPHGLWSRLEFNFASGSATGTSLTSSFTLKVS